jgi:hypothetical protein
MNAAPAGRGVIASVSEAIQQEFGGLGGHGGQGWTRWTGSQFHTPDSELSTKSTLVHRVHARLSVIYYERILIIEYF